MKQSPFITALSVAAGVLAVVVLLLAVVYERHYRHLRSLQPEMFKAQNIQNFLNALANDSVEYSKHNPAIDPILLQIGAKQAKAATPANSKPTSK